MSRISPLARIVLCAALGLLASPAMADSFLTTGVRTGSKSAAKIAPTPYTGGVTSPDVARPVARRAVQIIKATRNVAIGLEVIQRVDGVAMDNGNAAFEFAAGLKKLACKTGDPRVKLLRAANMAIRQPTGYAVPLARKAAAALPNYSAAQLVAGATLAQYDAFGKKINWDKPSRYTREAAAYINRATALEAASSHPRPLVREGLRTMKEYAALYGSFNGLLK